VRIRDFFAALFGHHEGPGKRHGLRPRRLLIVSHYFPPHVGGIERVAWAEASDLSTAGEEVRVLTSACGFGEALTEEAGEAAVCRVPAWNGLEALLGVPFPVFSPSLVTHSYRLVRWADIVHVHDSLYLSSWATVAWCRITHTPLIVTQHVEIVAHPRRSVILVQRVVYATLGILVLRTARRVAVLNTRVADFVRALGVADSRITFLPNGIDTDRFRPAQPGEAQQLRRAFGLPTERVLALFVGRFAPKKGLDKLLTAAGDEYVLVLVGGDPPPILAADKRCVFLGRLDPHQLGEVYRACDLFVLPSEGEGFPLSVQEAMASGLPIVMSDDPGFAAYRLDREQVLLIEPTPVAIRGALLSLAHNPQRRAAMGGYSSDFARREFGRDQHIRRLRRLLDEVRNERDW
jgi:glycosyltransferase involved in cell wall biosynthesis